MEIGLSLGLTRGGVVPFYPDATYAATFSDPVPRYKNGLLTSTSFTGAGGTFTRLGDESSLDGSRTYAPNVPAIVPGSGLQVYEQRTQLVTAPDNPGSWGVSGGTRAVGYPAPDGSLRAGRFSNTVSVNSYILIYTQTAANSTQYTRSVKAKYISGTSGILIIESFTGSVYLVSRFNTLTGVVTHDTPASTTGKMTLLPSGYYLCEQTITTAASGTPALAAYFVGGYGPTTDTCTMDLCDPQLEAGSFATPYIVNGKNLLVHGNDFSQGVWGKYGLAGWTYTTGGASGPATLHAFTEHLSDSYFSMALQAGLPLSTQLAVSWYVKKGARRYAYIYAYAPGDTHTFSAFFDLENLSATSVATGTATVGQATITDAGNGVYRVSVPGMISAGTGVEVTLGFSSNTGGAAGRVYSRTVGTVAGYGGGAQVERAVPTGAPSAYEATGASAGVRNKSTNYSSNPSSTTNMSLGGDASATLTTVNDSVALAAAGFSSLGPNVYKLDNSAGAGTAFVTIAGATGNTNPHMISAHARAAIGTGRIELSGGTGQVAFSSTAYARVSGFVTPTGTTQVLAVVAPAGSVVYFVGNQIEEGPYTGTSYDDTTTGTTSTRGTPSINIPYTVGASGTIYAEFYVPPAGLGNPRIVGTNGASDEAPLYISTDLKAGTWSGGAVLLQPTVTLVTGARAKVAVSWSSGRRVLALNGVIVGSDTLPFTTNSVTVLRPGLNNIGSAGNVANTTIAAVAVYPEKTNAELQALTAL